MQEWIGPVLDWLQAHAGWVGPLLGLVAFAESLVLVGLFVPGAVLMFAAGALVGTGHLAFWPLYLWAVAGAIAGDGLSFWIGRYFRGGLRRRWPFTHHPEILQRGMAFFAAHGGKGVFLGRFVGPIRPIIPAVAGMLDMPAWRFLLVNVVSAIGWAPAYLLPGVVFGASLAVAASVATRLVTLVVALLVTAWLLWRLPGWLRPLASRAVARLDRRWWWLLRGVRHRAGLMWWAALALLVVMCVTAVALPEPSAWERTLLEIADAHRTRASRMLLWLITQLGGTLAVTMAAMAVTAVLLASRRWRAAGAYAGSMALVVVSGYALKALFAMGRPNGLTGEAFGYAFPSGHSFGVTGLVVATVVLVAPPAWRSRGVLLTAAVGLAWLVALTRIGLGVHWPRDVIAGFALGAVGGGLLGLLGPARCPEWLRWRVLATASVALLAGAVITGGIGYPERLARYPVAEERSVLSATEACELALAPPAEAVWLGDVAALAVALERGGWQPAPAWGLQSALRWLSPAPQADALPIWPRFAAGRPPVGTWVRAQDGAERTVLWVWWRARARSEPVYLVGAERQRLQPRWPVLAVTRTPADVPDGLLERAGRLCSRRQSSG
ncbi:VTT domain-containing protein [Arhodomonas sp. AD133]|uniref:VTT domain-containing protein n=1 Tax=Arhodomonas sp. AD133 TaxID=3415009 RepID=UPI003EB6A3B8